MENGATASDRGGGEVMDRWTARKVRSIVLFYIVAVFTAFIVFSHFVFQSPEAVKALVLAAVGTLVATVPSVTGKVEYQLTESGIEKRTVKEDPDEYHEIFSWVQLERVVPMRHGFKYFKYLDETNALRRFWKLHLSDEYSGEVHAERDDRDRIIGLVEQRIVPRPERAETV